MELMVVIAIIGILSAISIPMITSPEHRIKKVARDLLGDVQKIKMAALKDNLSWRIIFATGGYTVLDGNINTVKTVVFSSYAEGVRYGHAGATTNATSGGGTFPVGDISYGANTLTFNPMGICNNGWVYLEYRGVTYAVGTLSTTGVIKIRRWAGGAWR